MRFMNVHVVQRDAIFIVWGTELQTANFLTAAQANLYQGLEISVGGGQELRQWASDQL